MQYSRPVRSVISLNSAHNVVRLASSATVISSPAGLPSASLMAASRFSSGNLLSGPAQPISIVVRSRKERITATLILANQCPYYLRLIHPPRQYSVVMNYVVNLLLDNGVVNITM